MKIILTDRLRKRLSDKVDDCDSFADSSAVEHLYMCKQLLALVASTEHGFIDAEPDDNGFMWSAEFDIGFNEDEYEVDNGAWDCIDEDNIDVKGDFTSIDISTIKESYFYDWCLEMFEDYEKDPEPFKIMNVRINGEWYVTEIEIVNRLKV